MNYIITTFREWLVIAALSCMVGCSVSVTGSVEPGVNLHEYNSMYIVKSKEAEATTAIEKDLETRGFLVSSGTEEEAPTDVQCLIRAPQKWMWDVTTYLLELKIEMIDNATGTLLASGRSYRTSLARKSPKYMVSEVMAKIFNDSDKGDAK